MAGITLAQAEAKLAEYLAAETAVMAGQRIALTGVNGGRDLTLADLSAIQAGITAWDTRARQLGASSAANNTRIVRRISVLS